MGLKGNGIEDHDLGIGGDVMNQTQIMTFPLCTIAREGEGRNREIQLQF